MSRAGRGAMEMEQNPELTSLEVGVLEFAVGENGEDSFAETSCF